jgi:hypothetical protein
LARRLEAVHACQMLGRLLRLLLTALQALSPHQCASLWTFTFFTRLEYRYNSNCSLP